MSRVVAPDTHGGLQNVQVIGRVNQLSVVYHFNVYVRAGRAAGGPHQGNRLYRLGHNSAVEHPFRA